MSFKGEIEARCPKGCEPFNVEVWSFIRGDKSPALREAILCRECNLILCPACNSPFIPPEPYVYLDAASELLAFVFPEAYREKEAFWRTKMHEDFLAMKGSLGGLLLVDTEPEIFFGVEELAELLEKEDYRAEEREVMEAVARELGLSLYRVSPRYARGHDVPSSLPYSAGRGAAVSRDSVIRGLEKLVAANDRLTTYSGYLRTLKASKAASLPPPPAARAA